MRPAAVHERLGPFQERRDGALPCVLGRGEDMSRARERPRIAHRRDVEHLREIAFRLGPSRPDEIELAAQLEGDTVDRPAIGCVGNPTLERIAALRIVTGCP